MKQQDFINALNRILAPLKGRVMLMVGRAVIAAVKDSTGVQELQLSVLAGETLDRVQRLQEFGFTSVPPVGSECILLALGGNRENAVVIATENRDLRVKGLAEGECALYTSDGTFIKLKKAGQVEVVTATKVTITAPNSEFVGNLKVTGNVEVTGTSKLTGAVTAEATIDATGNITSQANVVAVNVFASGLVGAAGFAGPGGTGPMTSTENISTTQNVISGATDMQTIHDTFNAHTHNENGTGGGVTNTPNSTL